MLLVPGAPSSPVAAAGACAGPNHPLRMMRPCPVGTTLPDMSDRLSSLSAYARRLPAMLVLVLTAAAFLAGCGSSSSTPAASSGQMAISAVKTAFASQVGALKSSLAALANTAMQLISSSTRASALQRLPGEVTAVKTAAGKLINATKCD